MAIKDLLVHVDNNDTCPERINVAVGLARRFDANLTGLYAHNLVAFPVYSGVAVPAYVMVEVESSARTNEEHAKKPD